MVKVTQFMPLTAMLGALAQAASPTIVFCTDAGLRGTCIDLPIASDSCVDFRGGLTMLYHEASSAVVPQGFLCSLSRDYGCTNPEVYLQSGSWNLDSVPSASGSTNFNDLTGSFSCSPI